MSLYAPQILDRFRLTSTCGQSLRVCTQCLCVCDLLCLHTWSRLESTCLKIERIYSIFIYFFCGRSIDREWARRLADYSLGHETYALVHPQFIHRCWEFGQSLNDFFFEVMLDIDDYRLFFCCCKFLRISDWEIIIVMTKMLWNFMGVY